MRFRKFLERYDYPGGYYTPAEDGDRLVQHFRTPEERKAWDDAGNDPHDNLVWHSDASRKKALEAAYHTHKWIATVAKDVLEPIADTAFKAALGDGLLSEIPIRAIQNDINKIEELQRKYEVAYKDIVAKINAEKDLQKQEQLKKVKTKIEERLATLRNLWRKWQDKNAV